MRVYCLIEQQGAQTQSDAAALSWLYPFGEGRQQEIPSRRSIALRRTFAGETREGKIVASTHGSRL